MLDTIWMYMVYIYWETLKKTKTWHTVVQTYRIVPVCRACPNCSSISILPRKSFLWVYDQPYNDATAYLSFLTYAGRSQLHWLSQIPLYTSSFSYHTFKFKNFSLSCMFEQYLNSVSDFSCKFHERGKIFLLQMRLSIVRNLRCYINLYPYSHDSQDDTSWKFLQCVVVGRIIIPHVVPAYSIPNMDNMVHTQYYIICHRVAFGVTFSMPLSIYIRDYSRLV